MDRRTLVENLKWGVKSGKMKSWNSPPFLSNRSFATINNLEQQADQKFFHPCVRGIAMRIGVDIGGTFTDFVIYHTQTR